MKSRMLVTVVALLALLSHECLLAASNDNPKLAVRLTPLVHLTRGDARVVVTVPRHADNRTLRVILESEDYYALSEVPLAGEDALVSHLFLPYFAAIVPVK